MTCSMCAWWYRRAAAMLALVLALGQAAWAGEPVGGINVSLEQIPGGITISFGNDDVPAIPQDFFGPGSEPFTGTVEMRLGGREDTSDVFEIEHEAWIELDGLPPGEPVIGILPVDNMHLVMSSKEPIEILIGGATFGFEATVTGAVLDAVGNPLPGQFQIDHEETLGGTAYAVDSFFDIEYRIEWTQVDGPFVFTTPTANLRIELQQDTPWRHSEPGGSSIDGFFLGTDGTSIIPYTFSSPNGGLVMNLYSTPIPEPATLGLFTLGSVTLLLRRRRPLSRGI